MRPLHASPKNDVIFGWPEQRPPSSDVQRILQTKAQVQPFHHLLLDSKLLLAQQTEPESLLDSRNLVFSPEALSTNISSITKRLSLSELTSRKENSDHEYADERLTQQLELIFGRADVALIQSKLTEFSADPSKQEIFVPAKGQLQILADYCWKLVVCLI
jgi:hypothetical protein